MTNNYKVVDIPNEYSVVVNIGIKDGIARGDKLEVFTIGKPIMDPDTNENLGTLDQIKAVLDVVDIYENMSLCKNSETEGVYAAALANMTANLISKRKPLEVEKTQVSFSLSTTDKKIKIGDSVRTTK